MDWEKAYQYLIETSFFAFIYYDDRSKKECARFWQKRDPLMNRYSKGERTEDLYKAIFDLKVEKVRWNE